MCCKFYIFDFQANFFYCKLRHNNRPGQKFLIKKCVQINIWNKYQLIRCVNGLDLGYLLKELEFSHRFNRRVNGILRPLNDYLVFVVMEPDRSLIDHAW